MRLCPVYISLCCNYSEAKLIQNIPSTPLLYQVAFTVLDHVSTRQPLAGHLCKAAD